HCRNAVNCGAAKPLKIHSQCQCNQDCLVRQHLCAAASPGVHTIGKMEFSAPEPTVVTRFYRQIVLQHRILDSTSTGSDRVSPGSWPLRPASRRRAPEGGGARITI